MGNGSMYIYSRALHAYTQTGLSNTNVCIRRMKVDVYVGILLNKISKNRSS